MKKTKVNIKRKKEVFIERILDWRKDNNRDYLFWRKTKNPYHILVSEMMLQKTTVNQVQEVVPIFIKSFPTPKDLSEADVDEIKKIITPLGMEHRRALRFKKWAEIVADRYDGRIPDTAEELVSFPGVGKYMANGVLCMAYGQDAPMLDTNAVRILERVFGVKSRKARPRTDDKLWDFLKDIIPFGRAREVNLAILDLGALVCTARNPRHSICPVIGLCDAYRNGII